MKNVNLEIVRIFAAGMILSVHIGQLAGFNFSVGAKGVQLFFILSGYLASVSLEKNPAVLMYYKKRVIRIVPLYWICLVGIYILDLILGMRTTSFMETISGQCGPQYLRYFIFLQCFTPTNDWNLWNNHMALWTMSSFVGFYFIAPFLHRIMKRFYGSMIILITFLFSRPYLISCIQKMFSTYPEEAHIEWFASMNPLAELYCFLLGMTLFTAFKEKRQNVYIMLILATLIVTGFSWYQFELVFVLLIAIAVSFDSIIENKKLCNIISIMSGGCFALYLFHPMVLKIAPIIWGRLGINNRWIYAFYLYALCIGVAYIMYYGIIIKIEKWIKIKWK